MPPGSPRRGLDMRGPLDQPPARAAWSGHFDKQLGEAEQRLTRCGIRARPVRTDDDPIQAMRDLLRGRPSLQAAA